MINNVLVKVIIPLLLLSGCHTNETSVEELSIAELISNSGVPGVSIAVINDFKIDYLEVYGVKDSSTGEPVTEQTLFQAASLSKSLTSMCALKFVIDRKIPLDENINFSLVSWQVPENSFTENEKVTLERLLRHTAGTTVSGFPGYSYGDPVPTLTQVLNGTPPANTPPVVVDKVPGTSFRYSGGGYCIVQQVLIDIEQIDFPSIMCKTVLSKLGMTHCTFEQPLPADLLGIASTGHLSNGNKIEGNFYTYPEMAAAGLWATPEDLALFLIELQLSLRGESNKVLSVEIIAQMMKTVLVNDYAMGLSITIKGGEFYFGHSGANQGFRCIMVAHKNSGVGAVVMTNSDEGFQLAEDIIYKIGTKEKWPGYN